MKRIAGFVAALVLVASACSDSPTAPGDNPLIAKLPMSPEAKEALARSMGLPSGPPANSNPNKQYLVTPPPFWNSAFGTNLFLGDDNSVLAPIGFAFMFYGRQYTGAWIGSNGYITFDGPFTQYSPTNLPVPPHPIIAGAFEDWHPGVAGAVLFNTVGQAPRRRFIATWLGVAVYGEGSTPQGTFQIQLLEGPLGVILINYNGLQRTTSHWGSPVTAGISSGSFGAFGGFTGMTILASGAGIPALDGHSFCLVPLGGAYRVWSDLICSLFVF
jgi:hypothetical protein